MRLIITEEEKKEIKDKYVDGVNQTVLTHLKRNFPISVVVLKDLPRPFRYIKIEDKSRNLDDNKKYLVNLIFDIIEDNFSGIEKNTIRRTIKYYLDVNRAEY